MSAGKPVFLDSLGEDPELAGIAFRIDASEPCIWSILGDFAAYANHVPSLQESRIYRDEEDAVCVRFLASHWLAGDYRYSTCHHFPWPSEHWGKFALDPGKDNDFASASGYWRTETLASAPDATLVVYAAEIEPRGGLAKFLRGQIVRRGLKTATRWLPDVAAGGAYPACVAETGD